MSAILIGIGALLFFLAVALGVSLFRRLDSQLRRLSACPRLSPLPVVELAPGHIRFANAAAARLAADVSGMTDIGAILPSDWEALVDELLVHGDTSTASRNVELGAETFAWSFVALGTHGVVYGYGMDITERKLAEEALRRQAAVNRHQTLHDSLTGLGNRRKLIDDAQRKLPLAAAEAPLALATFDLDGFKIYNDAFGHPAGDVLLARLAGRLRSALPGEATAYRIGGDEFCVLGETHDPESLVLCATEALSEVAESFTIGCSSGLALIPLDAGTLVSALQLADKRLHASKNDRRRLASSKPAGPPRRLRTGRPPRRALEPF